jgi:mono/diheme cytochrome c family protein
VIFMKHGGVLSVAVMGGLAAAAGIAIAHEWKAPEEAAKLRTPLAVNEATVTAGESLYRQHCTSCHGDDRRGMTAEAANLSTAAPDLIKNLKMHTEGGFFWKIREGRGDMPAFKEVLTDNEIWSIVTAIKQAATKK